MSDTTSKAREHNTEAVQGMNIKILLQKREIKDLDQHITYKNAVQVEPDHRIKCTRATFTSHGLELTSPKKPLRDRLQLFDTSATPSLLHGSDYAAAHAASVDDAAHGEARDPTASPRTMQAQHALMRGGLNCFSLSFRVVTDAPTLVYVVRVSNHMQNNTRLVPTAKTSMSTKNAAPTQQQPVHRGGDEPEPWVDDLLAKNGYPSWICRLGRIYIGNKRKMFAKHHEGRWRNFIF